MKELIFLWGDESIFLGAFHTIADAEQWVEDSVSKKVYNKISYTRCEVGVSFQHFNESLFSEGS